MIRSYDFLKIHMITDHSEPPSPAVDPGSNHMIRKSGSYDFGSNSYDFGSNSYDFRDFGKKSVTSLVSRRKYMAFSAENASFSHGLEKHSGILVKGCEVYRHQNCVVSFLTFEKLPVKRIFLIIIPLT